MVCTTHHTELDSKSKPQYGLRTALLLLGVMTTIGVAGADEPDALAGNYSELTEEDVATLWSKTPNECEYPSDEEDAVSESQTDLETLATCTDITFVEPPDIAEEWTTQDFQSLEDGGSSESVYPVNATLSNSTFIADGHATIFAIHPSTYVHEDKHDVPQYVAPEGELRGLIDYRIRVPADRRGEWSIIDDDVTAVRLKQDGERITERSGDQTPTLDYTLEGSGNSTLTLEADIDVELEQKYTDEVGDRTIITGTERHTDSLTVSSDLEVVVYNLTASVYHAEYPDGDNGVAIYQSLPWHGYILNEEKGAVVRGVWRYYNGHDTDWETLTRSSAAGREATESSAIPAYVHAFPSETGPRAEPIRDGPQIEAIWGTESESPNRTIHESVEIDVIDEPFTRSHGLAVGYDAVDRENLTVDGVVRGEQATLVEPNQGAERKIRESDLSATVIEQNESAATILVELRDAETGDPIVLDDPYDLHSRFAPIGAESREGYISVDDQWVQTDNFGYAFVTVSQPGAYSVEYHPGPWRTHDPAYVGDVDRVTWHPMTDASHWLDLVVQLLWLTIPFVAALYAGLKLGSFLQLPTDREL